KKSPPSHHANRGAMYHPGPGPEDAGPGAAPGAGQDYAPLWAAMPGARESLCAVGPPDRHAIADDGRARGEVGADRPGAGPTRHRADGRPARALGPPLTLALVAHQQIATQSRRLTHGKPLTRGKIVNAYDPTMAPICKGKSNCPPQFGPKPGVLAEPATGFVVAARLPMGNPSAVSSVLPLVDQVQTACARVTTRPTPRIHSLAGDLAVNDPTLRERLHLRGILTGGIPRTGEPLSPTPSPAAIDALLTTADLPRNPTPRQVQLACAAGYSRPVVESIIASLLSRGAGQLRYKGWHGACVQLMMAVLAHNAAT